MISKISKNNDEVTFYLSAQQLLVISVAITGAALFGVSLSRLLIFGGGVFSWLLRVESSKVEVSLSSRIFYKNHSLIFMVFDLDLVRTLTWIPLFLFEAFRLICVSSLSIS